MKITKHIHSCVLVEDQGEKILIDPGTFTFIENKISPNDFRDLTAILITHKHGDHVDPAALKIILDNNPDAKVYTNQETKDILPELADRIEIFETGERSIGKFQVTAFPAEHGKMISAVPTNTAFVINNEFMHVGDSIDPVIFQHPTKILALPVAAPWLTMLESYNFAEGFKPELVLPVHDGYIKDFFNDSMYQVWDKVLSEKGVKFAGYGSIG